MRIPVFVSRPTALNAEQQRSLDFVCTELEAQQLEPRTLGQSDYPSEFPLREVLSIARHCAGGVVLGFTQFETERGVWKKGTKAEREQTEPVVFPTPWNHLEAGILYGLRLPLLIFREPGISGGIFDIGVTDLFVHNLPAPPLKTDEMESIRQVFLKWGAKVREYYYADPRIL